jgi:hypothetical protein
MPLIGVTLVVSAAWTSPGECDFVAVGRIGWLLATGAAACWLIPLALRGVSATIDAYVRSGSVLLTQRTMIIDSPGVLREPAVLDRAWIRDVSDSAWRPLKDVFTADDGSGTAARVTLGMTRPRTKIDFDRPIAFLHAVGAPTYPRSLWPGPPTNWRPVTSVVLRFADTQASTAAIREWLSAPISTTGAEPLAPAARPTRRVGWIVALVVVGLTGGVLLFLNLPSASCSPALG